jgi:hypothetical protein
MEELSARQEREQQILSLYSDLQEVDSEIARHTQERDRLRQELSILVAEMDGQKAIIPGVARLELTAPSVTRSYDTKQVSKIIENLIAQGAFELAQQLVGCQKESQRAGSLRITPERKKGT